MLYPPWISWYLFALILMMIPVDLIISLPGMLSKNMSMYAPTVLEKDEEAALKLVTTENRPYPVRCVIAKLQVSGDGFSVMCNLRCSSKKNEQRDVVIDTSHSGVTVFELKQLRIISMLGLFSLPVKINITKAVLVLPPPLEPSDKTTLQHGMQLKPKPGGGFSEEHDMRAYQQGDPVRNIHWKASAKFDSLIIREPLVPPRHNRLVHIMPWKTITECDLILGRLRWISDYFLKWDMPFYIKFNDDNNISEITQEKELVDFLCNILNKTEEKTTKQVASPTRFSWIYRIDASDYGKQTKKEVKQ